MTSTVLEAPGVEVAPYDAMAVAQAFTDTIHTCRNMLMAARGYAELIQRRTSEPTRHSEWAAKMIHQLDRLTELYARMAELAPPPSTWTTCSLDSVLSRAERMARMRLSEPARSTVMYRETALAAEVLADADELCRAMCAVLENAFEATPVGGTVSVALLAHSPGRFQLTVDDDGPGLGLDAQQRVGRPFFTTKPERLGLGLFLARAILGRYGLRLQLANRPEGGARATITTTTAEGGLQ